MNNNSIFVVDQLSTQPKKQKIIVKKDFNYYCKRGLVTNKRLIYSIYILGQFSMRKRNQIRLDRMYFKLEQ